MQILKPKFDSHEASFDSQTRTSMCVSTAQFSFKLPLEHSIPVIFSSMVVIDRLCNNEQWKLPIVHATIYPIPIL
jgi:hypothetical protein